MRTFFPGAALCAFLCTLTVFSLDSAAQDEGAAAKPNEGAEKRNENPAQAAEKPDQVEDLYALELINSDLANANSTLDQFDLNNNRRLDAAESRRLARLGWPTEKFDLNKDGALSMVEIVLRFAAQRKEFDIIPVDEAVANGFLRRFDLNKDRIVDADEMRKTGWPDEPERWDLDKDGRLSFFEMAHIHSVKRRWRDSLGVTGIDNGTAGRLIELNDKNHDRKLNAEEFRAAVHMEIPKSYDTDEDGELSLDEIAAGYARKRHEHGATLEDQKSARWLVRRYDLNRDNVVDEREQARWEEEHQQFDLDKNGRIDLLEVTVVFAHERAKEGVTQEDQVAAARVLARYDRNRNGSIDLGEAEGRQDKENEPAGDDATAAIPVTTEAFIDFDSDADGKLTVRELARYVASRRKK